MKISPTNKFSFAATLVLILAGCAVHAEPVAQGTRYSAPIIAECTPTDTSPLPKPKPADSTPAERGAKPAAATFKSGKVYFFCPDFPCPACDRVDSRYTKIEQPYPAGFEWVNEYGNANGWPVMYWRGKDNWHRRVGYESVEATEAIVNPPKQAEMPTGYPVRGSWWTHPGDVWSHLMGSPHNFSADYVRTLSRAEAESLHSDDHEGRVKGNPPRRGAIHWSTSYQRPQRQSRFRATGYYCPPGSS